MTDRNAEIARTILEQLGGNKFLAMTGVKDLVSGDASLQFKLPRRTNDITHVCITLDVNDTYRVSFKTWNARKLYMRIAHTQGDVYADQLRAVFTEQTGLDTSL